MNCNIEIYYDKLFVLNLFLSPHKEIGFGHKVKNLDLTLPHYYELYDNCERMRIKQRLIDCHEQLNNSSKCVIYKYVIDQFCMQNIIFVSLYLLYTKSAFKLSNKTIFL